MLDKEQRIKEQRTIEATRKGYVGMTGKLACIVRNLGQPIVSETPLFWSHTEPEDPWAMEEEGDPYDGSRILDAEEDDCARDIGFTFDGLRFGMHLEIKHLSDNRSLGVTYKGIPVYLEANGELHGYAPFPEWEGMIERLYPMARRVADQRKRARVEEDRQKAERKLGSFLHELRLRWGL